MENMSFSFVGQYFWVMYMFHISKKVIFPNTEAKCLENDIGETSNYDIGNIITCSGYKKKRKKEEGKVEGGREPKKANIYLLEH